MDIEHYHNDVLSAINALRAALPPGHCTLGIRKFVTINGVVASDMAGDLHFRGFTLQVAKERISAELDGTIMRAYRYRISQGTNQIIRFQTVPFNRYPPNAHFAPNYLSTHFTNDRWPGWMRDLDFIKMYRFFRELVAAQGVLPEPFRSA